MANETVFKRYAGNPIVTASAVPRANSIHNSAIVKRAKVSDKRDTIDRNLPVFTFAKPFCQISCDDRPIICCFWAVGVHGHSAIDIQTLSRRQTLIGCPESGVCSLQEVSSID